MLRAVDKSVETVDKLSSGRGLDGMAVGVFAKEPVAGRVKTRLCPPLTPAQAAQLYRISLLETVSVMSDAGFDPVVFYTGDEAFFRRTFPRTRLVPQGEGNLGERMERALELLLGECAAAVLIGSDSPDLPPSHVKEAFAALAEADFVTAPSRDGGYVLVGERRHHPELFRNIPWSTDAVLETTRRRAVEESVNYGEVGGWDDVDDLVSLTRLLLRSPSTATSRFARKILFPHSF
jgi:rSAM/selenodomain-associated transferase 1